MNPADRLDGSTKEFSSLSSGGLVKDRLENTSDPNVTDASQKSEFPISVAQGLECSSFDSRSSPFEGRPFSSAMPMIESMLKKCCEQLGFPVQSKAKPMGNVFPLPTSVDCLRGVVELEEDGLLMLRCLCMALNNYAGESLEGPVTVCKLHGKLLKGLSYDVSLVSLWGMSFGPLSWESFFKSRGVDYVGDEVANAKYTSWENLRGAIPDQVGSVDLSEVSLTLRST